MLGSTAAWHSSDLNFWQQDLIIQLCIILETCQLNKLIYFMLDSRTAWHSIEQINLNSNAQSSNPRTHPAYPLHPTQSLNSHLTELFTDTNLRSWKFLQSYTQKKVFSTVNCQFFSTVRCQNCSRIWVSCHITSVLLFDHQLSELFTDTKKELEETASKLTITAGNLGKATDVLTKTKKHLKETEKARDENAHLLSEHVHTETELYTQATQVSGILLHFWFGFVCASTVEPISWI